MKNKVFALFPILLFFVFVPSVFAQYIGATTTQPAKQFLIEKKIGIESNFTLNILNFTLINSNKF